MRGWKSKGVYLISVSVIDEYFPIEYGRLQREDVAVRPKRGTVRAVEGEDGDGQGVKPAERYAIFSGQDILGTVPGELATVIGSASRWAGVDADELGGIVERLERRLSRRWREQCRDGGDEV